MINTHKIIPNKGHYEIYDDKGNFVSSGDTWEECYNDLLAMFAPDIRGIVEMEKFKEAVAV